MPYPLLRHDKAYSSIRPGSLPRVVNKPTVSALAAPLGRSYDGVAQRLERGEELNSLVLERELAYEGPLQTVKAPLHEGRPLPNNAKIMTGVSGFSKMTQYHLDYDKIEKLPPKMTVKELKNWENLEVQRSIKEARRAAALAKEANRAKKKSLTPPPTLPETDAPDRADPRTYTELLDLYSMHEFIIRKGKALRVTPEFASFKRHYAAFWGSIESLIEKLEILMQDYGVDLAYIDGKKLAQLATYDIGQQLSTVDMISCIANADEIGALLFSDEQRFHHGKKGHDVAAAKIQSAWRMYRQRVAYHHLLIGTRAATLIQRQWALYRAHCITRKAIQTLRETRLMRWKQTMEEFVRKWPRIRESKRTVIHIPSLSYPTFHAKKIPFYTTQQIGQLTRLYELSDPSVEIVFVTPFKPEVEAIEYYYNLLEEAGVRNPEGRVTLLVPENAKRLPEGISLTRSVLLCARLMKCLAAIATGKPAYIVPGVIGPEELLLASELNIPMLGPEPRIAQAFGTKSGSHKIFEAAEVNTPVGAYKLRKRSELIQALSTLMAERTEVQRWLVKLDTDCGSKGHAYFDVSRMKSFNDPTLDGERLRERVLRELLDNGSKRVRLLHPASYPDWNTFLATFDVVGGCIQAVPTKILANVTANLYIEPNSEVHLQSVLEPLLAPSYTVLGSTFPYPPSIPYNAIRDAAFSVGRAAFRKRIMGYASVDFVVYESSTDGISCTRVVAVDLDLHLTNNAVAHNFAATLSNSVWDPENGTLVQKKTMKSISYIYSGVIYNPYISALRHAAFFSTCRSRGLAFDRENKTGVVFHMLDVLLRGCLGILTIGDKKTRIVKQMSDFQSLLNFELPKQGEHSASSNFAYFSSVIRALSRLASATQKLKM